MSENKKEVKRGPVDFILMMSTLVLVIIGIIMVFSSSWPEAMEKTAYQDGYMFVKRQMIYAGIGFIVMIFFMNLNYTIWRRFSIPIYIVSIALAALTLTSKAGDFKGANRWVSIAGISFMPGDIVKLGSIIFFSSFLSTISKDFKTYKNKNLWSLIIIAISLVFIIIQKDLGTTIVLAITMFSMYIVSGMSLSFLGFLVGAGVAAITFITKKSLDKLAANPDGKFSFRIMRIISFLDPFAYKISFGWQAVQSLYALGSGGIVGLGLGKSKQKFHYIPESYNDFIYAIIGEELGFIGATLVIILYMIIIWRGVTIAANSKDKFGMYMATGISALIASQSLIHIAVVTSSIPTTGITLPFVSYGGTSLVLYMASVGILLNISRTSKIDRG